MAAAGTAGSGLVYKRLLLKLFSDGLVSGTTHTCLGQELCQM